MPSVKLEIKGLDSLRNSLKKYPKISKPIIQRAIKTTAFDILRETKLVTPVDTGRLRGSFRTSFGDTSAIIQPQVDYAVYVHEGTSRQQAQPFFQYGVWLAKNKVDANFEWALETIAKKLR